MGSPGKRGVGGQGWPRQTPGQLPCREPSVPLLPPPGVLGPVLVPQPVRVGLLPSRVFSPPRVQTFLISRLALLSVTPWGRVWVSASGGAVCEKKLRRGSRPVRLMAEAPGVSSMPLCCHRPNSPSATSHPGSAMGLQPPFPVLAPPTLPNAYKMQAEKGLREGLLGHGRGCRDSRVEPPVAPGPSCVWV